MIVAKTRMRKIPKTCKGCALSFCQFDGRDSYRVCAIMLRDCPMEDKGRGNYGYTKPDWCPLVEIEKN